MKQIYRSQPILKTIGILHPSLLAMTAAFLLVSPSAFAATEFQGSLNNVSITDATGTNTPPTATFTYTKEGDAFTFDASTSTDSDGAITVYKWDFGDGQTATGVNVTHTYYSNNTYPVTLSVTDNNGGISLYQNAMRTVSVQQLIEDSDTGNISQNKAYGQGLFFTEATTVQSITIKTGPSLYGASPIKLRIGTTKDLSVSFLAESDEKTITSKNSEYEFEFNQPVQLSAQTQYYFTISVTNDLTSNYTDFACSATDVYNPVGCPDCHRYYKSSAKWNSNGIKYLGDLFFKIN
jgi:PKD repeat protein